MVAGLDARTSVSAQVALAGCSILRPAHFRGGVEIVSATPVPRAFPTHVSSGLGVCLKRGGAHGVISDGRKLVYPADSVCVRAPGCVWSSEAAAVSFLSIDVAPELLPDDFVPRTMRCGRPGAALDVAGFAARLQDPSPMAHGDALAELVLALADRAALDGGRSLSATASPRTIRRACALLREHMAYNLSLDQLASALGVNKFVLVRQFRRELGTTPHRYQNLMRIERARDELAAGKSGAEIALGLGFADQAHFSRLFKRVVGVAPGQYRRQVRTRPA